MTYGKVDSFTSIMIFSIIIIRRYDWSDSFLQRGEKSCVVPRSTLPGLYETGCDHVQVYHSLHLLYPLTVQSSLRTLASFTVNAHSILFNYCFILSLSALSNYSLRLPATSFWASYTLLPSGLLSKVILPTLI
jgi:hypothetical protein